MSLARDVRHVHADLTVLLLAGSAAPLPLHADRGGPLLGEGRGVKHDHAVGLPQVGTDLPGERQEQGRVAPGDKADESPEALPFLVMEGGNPFTRLALGIRGQTGQVLDGVVSLLGFGKRGCERLNEGLQARQQTPGHFRRHLGLRQHLLPSGVESPIHNEPPSVKPPWRKRLSQMLL
jgi:hypothetical protein